MKRTLIATGAVALTTVGVWRIGQDALGADEGTDRHVWNFDRDEAGTLPAGWKVESTNPRGPVATWTVQADRNAPSKPNVLALTDPKSNRGSAFNLCWTDQVKFKDGVIEVKVKAGTGREDQGGGPIWRVQDKDNYYIARWNPLEDNFRVYYVKDGRRAQIDSARVHADPAEWHTIRVEHEGDEIECYLDGKELLKAHDTTFAQAGGVGLWTKADAATSFDDVVVLSPADNDDDNDHAHAGGQVILWKAAPVDRAPKIDGVQDAVWSNAQPVNVEVRKAIGAGRPRMVTLRGVYTKDTLYVLAQWPDQTRSNMRDPYVWNASKNAYERPTKPDDQFALEFPISGQFDRNMLSTEREFTADVWHWKAGRTNPGGWVDDKRHIIRHSSFEGAKEYRLGGHATVYIARPNDAGTVPYRHTPAPSSHVGDIVDSYESQEPTGSCADVRGKGVHDGSKWTLEIARKLNTGQSDDAVIHHDRENPCAIAVLDDELYWHHSVSPLIHLRFESH